MRRLVVLAPLALAVPFPVAAQDPPAGGTSEAPRLEVFDVRDLLATPRDFPPARLGLLPNAPGADAGAAPIAPPAADRDAAMAALVAALRALPGVDWRTEHSIEVRGHQLLVRQAPTALAAIRAALAARREAAQRLVAIEARFLALPHENGSARALPRGLHVIDASQAERLLARCRTDADARLLHAPRLTAFDGQLANVVTANQVAYVAGLELEAAPGTLVADPVVGTLQEGTALAVRARRLDGDGHDGWLALDLDLQVATLLRPIPELRTKFGTLQVPQVVAQAQRGSVRVPDGGWVLVAGLADVPADGSTPGTLLVLVRAKSVALDGAPGGRGR